MQNTKIRVAFLLSHPIQYLSPLLKKLSGESWITLKVIYCSDHGVKASLDRDFGRKIQWDIDLLEGYDHVLLENRSPWPSIFNAPCGLINPSVINELKKGDFDALIVHGYHYITHILAIIWALMTGLSLYIRCELPLNQELLKPKFKRRVRKCLLGRIFKKMKGCLAIGSQNADLYRYMGVPDERIHLMPYSVDNERYLRSSEELKGRSSELKRSLGIPPDALTVLFSGKLIHKKRPLDLLRAVAAMGKDNIWIIYVGEGPLREDLIELSNELGFRNIHMAGFVNQHELPVYYTAADIFVLPSGSGETWGLVLNEAMCFSLPVIVSDMPGSAYDLVKEGENGYIYPVGDIAALTDRLNRVIGRLGSGCSTGDISRRIISRWGYEEDIKGMKTAFSDKINSKGEE